MECPKCGYQVFGRWTEVDEHTLITHRRKFVADMCEREDTWFSPAEAARIRQGY